MYIPSNISSPEQIHKELEEIQTFLEAQYAADISEEVQSRFDSLAAYMARSGKLKADAEWHYNHLSYKFILTWADRVNRSCTHQHEGMRSVMSTLRSERFSQNYGR